MTLQEKLNTINHPRIQTLERGYSETIEDFWNDFIVKLLPEKEIVFEYHDLLMEYVKRPDAMFAIRGCNTAPKEKYDDLRRGFLTKTNEGYSFFYTDNFHAAYYRKMAIDGFVPVIDELVTLYNNRLFPARFGRDTKNERVMMALPKGKDPGIQTSGYKIAHIFNVGKDYCNEEGCFSLTEIMERYFPRGIREDWNKNIDAGEEYYIRMLKVPSEARKYIVAEFLRFVHPFNYFFTPKKACAYSMVCKDIAEYPELIKFVKYKYSELYGSKYSEYLNAIMIDNQGDAGIENKVIDLSYGTDMDNYPLKENNTFESLCTHKDRSSALNIKNKRSIDTISWEIQYAVIFEFLTNPKTSFRKLETDIMGIESKSNGGGFKSKGIINSYGFTVKDKGKLSEVTIDEFINSVEGIKKEVLLKIKNLINNKMP